jgi:hypothetical protein
LQSCCQRKLWQLVPNLLAIITTIITTIKFSFVVWVKFCPNYISGIQYRTDIELFFLNIS